MTHPSSISTRVQGRRTYVVGDTYPHRRALRAAGAHWDTLQRAWWIGDRAKADELVAALAGQAQPADTGPANGAVGGLVDDDKIIGKATYKGKSYILVWEGQTKRGPAAKLAFADGSKVFWADVSEVTVIKRYREPSRGDRRGYGRVEAMTFGRLRRLQEEWRQKSADERAEDRHAAELGGRCRCARPLDEGDGECMTCGYLICT